MNYRALALILGITALASGCGGGGGGGGSGDSDGGGGNDGGGDTTETTAVSGASTKGPLQNAVVEVFALDTSAVEGKGASVATGATDAQAQVTGLEIPDDTSGPLVIEFRADEDTTDLTTGQSPIISRLTTIRSASSLLAGDRVFATPLTSIAVRIALANIDTAGFGGNEDGTVTEAEVDNALTAAQSRVRSMFGFGLLDSVDLFTTPPLLLAGETDDADVQEAVTKYRTAVEAVGALSQKVAEDIDSANGSSTGTTSAEAAFEALAEDATDGAVDGSGSEGAIDAYGASGSTAAANTVDTTDPETLPIPNEPGDRTVADTKDIVKEEKEETGNDSAEDTSVDSTDTNTVEGNAESDIDGDGTPDSMDDDIDGDGVTNDPDNDAFPLDPDEQFDTDGDGIGNNTDTDDDGDNVPDETEQEPDGSGGLQDVDTDGDGTVDRLDTDSDGDGIGDTQETADVDGDGVNEDLDSDGDGIVDRLDTDADDDGVADSTEGTDDTNGSGIPDFQDPNNDTDGDGLSNSEETNNLGTDPESADTDGDGVEDGEDDFPLDDTKDTAAVWDEFNWDEAVWQ